MSVITGAVRSRPNSAVLSAFSWLAATPLRRALAVTAGWRVAIGVWGIVAHGLVAKGPYASDTLMRRGWPSNPLSLLIDSGVRMDAFWYARIAQHGYTFGTKQLSSIAYFPLFPALIKVVSFVTGDVYVAGTIISTASLFLAVWALQSWLDLRGMGRSSALTVGLMLCFPVGFFWAAMYTESLFLALALATFVFFERKQWWPAAGSVFLAVLCRPTGLILAPALAILAIQGGALSDLPVIRQWAWIERLTAKDLIVAPKGRALAWLPVIAGPLAYACFGAYQWFLFGTPLATVRADQVPPFSRNLSRALADLTLQRPGMPAWYLAVLLAIGLLFLAAVPLVYRRFGAAYACFAALAVLFPMSTGLPSLERYVMVDFPVFACLAMVKVRAVPATMMIAGFYMMLGLMALFIAGYTVI